MRWSPDADRVAALPDGCGAAGLPRRKATAQQPAQVAQVHPEWCDEKRVLHARVGYRDGQRLPGPLTSCAPALSELYPDPADLFAKRKVAAQALTSKRLLLPSDADAYGVARTLTVVANPNYPGSYAYSYP